MVLVLRAAPGPTNLAHPTGAARGGAPDHQIAVDSAAGMTTAHEFATRTRTIVISLSTTTETTADSTTTDETAIMGARMDAGDLLYIAFTKF